MEGFQTFTGNNKYHVLVIHVAKFKERGESIEKQMRKIGLDFRYILEGDVEDIDYKVLARYFKDGHDRIFRACPMTSCTLKHFYAYEYILNHNLSGALVLEDDAILEKDFLPKFEQSIREFEEKYLSKPVIISYENSALMFVPRSQRRTGQMLYLAKKDRYAGGYFINRQAAKVILDEVKKNKCELVIDGFHNWLLQQGKILYFWCHPTLIQQGTVIGKFPSSLSSDDWLLKLRWYLKLYYKHLLYYLR